MAAFLRRPVWCHADQTTALRAAIAAEETKNADYQNQAAECHQCPGQTHRSADKQLPVLFCIEWSNLGHECTYKQECQTCCLHTYHNASQRTDCIQFLLLGHVSHIRLLFFHCGTPHFVLYIVARLYRFFQCQMSLSYVTYAEYADQDIKIACPKNMC